MQSQDPGTASLAMGKCRAEHESCPGNLAPPPITRHLPGTGSKTEGERPLPRAAYR